VGIPLEIDKNNLRKWEYVRVKIGCRDVSKVPATVEGLLDLHFFDFNFQREVVVGGSSSAWNTWTRNADRSNEDNPSPKKARKEGGEHFQQGGTSGTAEQKSSTQQQQGGYKGKSGLSSENMEQEVDKGKQLLEGEKSSDGGLLEEEGEKANDVTKDSSEEGSDDSGPYFEDLLSPGGEHLHFGTWKPAEVQKIARMQVAEEKSVAFNEYGSNLIKYKFDPLAVIEAKFAMAQGVECAKKGTQPVCSQENVDDEEKSTRLEFSEGPCHPSPGTGTQEEPGCDLSSQEEVEQKGLKTQGVESMIDASGDTQMSPCWESIEEENEKEEEDMSLEKENLGVAIGMENSEVVNELGKTLNPTNISSRDEQGWKRQSQRIKDQGWDGVKMLDKATWATQKKNLEGNQLNFKNSFAVLDNNELVIRSKKMGIDITNLDLEKFDVLKDLEKARACLKDKAETLNVSEVNENNHPLPVEEMKYIEWKSDSSDEEGFRVVSSQRSKKRGKKLRLQKNGKAKVVESLPNEEISPFEEGINRGNSIYNLRRGAAWKTKNSSK
jgi:hypothetical protein